MKTYLSIDIDFFNKCKSTSFVHHILDTTFSKAHKFKIPTIAVMNHQQLLPRVNDTLSKLNGKGRLINVDYHSDICSVIDLHELNCGTWISYVKNRNKYDYLWYHYRGQSLALGNCNSGNHWDYGTDWKTVNKEGIFPDTIPGLINNNVLEIGFVMSPGWARYDLRCLFKHMVKKYKIRYKRGRIDEESMRQVKSPPRII
jgi:hypothetical protein